MVSGIFSGDRRLGNYRDIERVDLSELYDRFAFGHTHPVMSLTLSKWKEAVCTRPPCSSLFLRICLSRPVPSVM
ncbi:MAG: hypothetical protein A4E57_04658 [Syntrophorhabdaceae bacterium PtaU1.Bin034]|nr:MAG: hypothetical protein A4E57_04658 [Syntrophorhabdaceae bacterium PtaU1.Bin034]